MSKLSIEDLDKISSKVKRETNLRDGAGRAKITVHMGTCGIAAGARKIMNTLLELLKESETDDVILTTSGCVGFCSREPMATVELKGEAPVKYIDLDEEMIKKIFFDHVLGGKIVTEDALGVGSEREA